MIQINFFQGSALSIEQQSAIENTARIMRQIKSRAAIAKMSWPLPGLSVDVGIREILIKKGTQPVAAIRGDWDA
jgi:hypothetical protein